MRASSFQKVKRKIRAYPMKREPDPKHGLRFQQPRVRQRSGIDRHEPDIARELRCYLLRTSVVPAIPNIEMAAPVNRVHHVVAAGSVEDLNDFRAARPFGDQFAAGSIGANVESGKIGFQRIAAIEQYLIR